VSRFVIQVFDEYTPQLEVYKESTSLMPRKLLNGISCAVMAYGQTGSGKVRPDLREVLFEE
jgi:Kinesin motor domain